MSDGNATPHRAALVLGNCYFDHRRDFEDFDWNVLQIGEEFERALNAAGYSICLVGRPDAPKVRDAL